MPSGRCRVLDRSEPSDAPKTDPADATRPVAFRGAGFAPKLDRRAGWIALALVIAVWQLASGMGWVNPLFLPAPTAIVRAIWQLAASGALWQHLGYSVMRIGVGWLLGT